MASPTSADQQRILFGLHFNYFYAEEPSDEFDNDSTVAPIGLSSMPRAQV